MVTTKEEQAAEAEPYLWNYRALKDSFSNYDGDTLRCSIDLGFEQWFVMKHQSMRLYGVNAPELRKPTYDAGKAAKDALASAIQAVPGDWVWLRTIQDRTGKYGRWLVILFDNPLSVKFYESINEKLLEDPNLGYTAMFY